MPRGSNFKRPYPPEFRREAVALYRSGGRSLSEVAGGLGISTESLRVWVAQSAVDAGKREGADDGGALGAARAAPAGADARAGARDLEKSRGLLRAGERDAVSLFRFIAAEKANYSISQMCRMLEVSRSGFHAWERRAPAAATPVLR